MWPSVSAISMTWAVQFSNFYACLMWNIFPCNENLFNLLNLQNKFSAKDFRTIPKGKTLMTSFVNFEQVLPMQLSHITFKAIFIKSTILDVGLGTECSSFYRLVNWRFVEWKHSTVSTVSFLMQPTTPTKTYWFQRPQVLGRQTSPCWLSYMKLKITSQVEWSRRTLLK